MSAAEEDDPSLLADWVDHGNERAFHALVNRYAGLVHHAAKMRAGRDDSIAAEASQATFILLARRASSLTGRSSLAGWLHATAVHQAANLYRGERREVRRREKLSEQPDLTGTGVWEHLRPELDRALAGLSACDREALLLRYYRDMSVAEVAQVLGITVSAAKKRLERVTGRLRNRLAARGCMLPVAAIGAALPNLAGEAQAGLSFASGWGSGALVAGAAGPVAPLAGLIAFLARHAVLATGTAVLVAAGVFWAVHSQGGQDQARPGISTGTTVANPVIAAVEAGKIPISTRKRPQREWPALTARYGDSRTQLATHVCDGILDVMGQIAVVGEPVFSSGSGNLDKWKTRLNLSPEQKAHASKLVKEHFHTEAENYKARNAFLREHLEPIVESTLASDACARKVITRAEYDEVMHRTEEARRGNPLLSNRAGGFKLGGDLLVTDPGLRAGFEALLTPEQQEIFNKEAPLVPAVQEENEPIELEKLDEMLQSMRSLMPFATSGFKLIDSANKNGLLNLDPDAPVQEPHPSGPEEK